MFHVTEHFGVSYLDIKSNFLSDPQYYKCRVFFRFKNWISLIWSIHSHSTIKQEDRGIHKEKTNCSRVNDS